MNNQSNALSSKQVFDGQRLIKVFVRDFESQEDLGTTWITRAKLAKLMQPDAERPVVAKDGLFVIQLF